MSQQAVGSSSSHSGSVNVEQEQPAERLQLRTKRARVGSAGANKSRTRKGDAYDFEAALGTQHAAQPAEWTRSGELHLLPGTDVFVQVFIKRQAERLAAQLLGKPPPQLAGSTVWLVGTPAAGQPPREPLDAGHRAQLTSVKASGSKDGGRARWLPSEDPVIFKKQAGKIAVEAVARVCAIEGADATAVQVGLCVCTACVYMLYICNAMFHQPVRSLQAHPCI